MNHKKIKNKKIILSKRWILKLEDASCSFHLCLLPLTWTPASWQASPGRRKTYHHHCYHCHHHGSSFVIIHHHCYHRPRWFVLSSGRMAPSWLTQHGADNIRFSYHENFHNPNFKFAKNRSAQQLMLQKLVLSSSLLWTGMLIAGQSCTINSTILEDKPTHHDCHP